MKKDLFFPASKLSKSETSDPRGAKTKTIGASGFRTQQFYARVVPPQVNIPLFF